MIPRVPAEGSLSCSIPRAQAPMPVWKSASVLALRARSNQRESTVFRIAEDKTRYKLYESIVAASQGGIRAAPLANPAATPAETLAVAGSKARLDRLGAAAKTLTQLGSSAGLQEELKFIAGWIGAVGTSIEETRKEREAHMAQGMASVAEKRSQVTDAMNK